MSKPQYAILRFAKYKGPEIGNIEAHNERTKEKYASNPDVDISRSKYNFHLIEPERKYRAEAERQIKEAGCRTRSDSVRVVEALVTGGHQQEPVQFPFDRAGTKISCGGRAADQRSRLPYPVRQCSSRGSPGNCHTGVLSWKEKI